MKKASRYRPDAADGDRERANGQEETGRRARRGARLVRDLRRPDGVDDELLRDARRVLQPGSAEVENRRWLDAGSVGVQTEARYSGIIESDGVPTRPKLKNTAHIPPEEASNTPTPDEMERSRTVGARLKTDREFALASASLRQALQDMPELTEVSKHIMFEETSQGLNLEIVDQDGRSMFADGSKVPYERTRLLISKTCRAAQGDTAAGRDRRPHSRGLCAIA